MDPLHIPWLLLSLPYAPLITRVLFFFVHDDFFVFRNLNRGVGRIELFLGWIRDFAMIPFSLFVLGNRIYGWGWFGDPLSIPWEVVVLGLSLYARWWRWHGLAPLHEFARLNPRVHPTEFFEHLYARLGFLPHRVPRNPKKTIDPYHLNFRTNKDPKQSFWILLRGVYNTFLFTTLVYKTFRWKGAHYIKTAGSGLSLIWASRIAQLAKMEVLVEKSPELSVVKQGKQIFVINHKSFFDFCLAPLAYLKENADGSAASFTPRVMVAKDHFRDNFFSYRIMGFGQMLEAWGMIFVDRKSKESGKAKRAVSLTVQKLLSSDMAFSIYPQGTRARGQFDRDGSRWDAGYFCVGKKERLKKEGGYFKKGVTFIAAQTALSLLKHQLAGPVWIIPVGMNGPGTACPKSSLKVQTQTKIVIRLGNPIRIDPEEMRPHKDFSYQEILEQPAYRQKIDELTTKIDQSLQQLLDVATRLERRFFMDLREILDPRGVDEVAVALKQWRKQGDVYVILDYIYALPMKYWRGFLSDLANLLRYECTKEDLVGLRNKIADCF